MTQLLDALGELLKEVSEREILPRWKHLAEGDITSKASVTDPDDLVTVADRAAESFLTERLPALLPGSLVIGEEAVSQDPSVLDAMHADRPVWLVDPVDGTKNFAAGEGAFGVMVALVERGETLISGIYLPVDGDLYLAERGSGATWNGRRLAARAPGPNELSGTGLLAGSIDWTVHARTPGPNALSGTLYTHFMPPAVLASLNTRPERLKLAPSPQCAAFEYTRIARGERDFALYYRLFPWDHAPGILILREAGGVARHPNGGEYAPRNDRPLLLVAADEARWETVRRALVGADRPPET